VIGQRALIALALASGALAGVLYYVGAQRAPVVIAARDVDATHPLVAEDVAIASLPLDAVPEGAIGAVDAVIGKVPRAPLWRGQALLEHALTDDGAAFHTGLTVSAGLRAVALPVVAAQAVGGALVPGARVDVIAVPVAGRAPAGRPTEILVQRAIVLDLRTESGAPYGAIGARNPIAAASERIASVVIAIDAADEIRFADRIATSTFVLAFVGSR
jgi:Flp pilus assembly protein CpaB